MGSTSNVIKSSRRRRSEFIFLNEYELIDGESGEPKFSRNLSWAGNCFVNRQKMEADGKLWCDSQRDYLYASMQIIRDEIAKIEARYDAFTFTKADIKALKEAMAAAHPDRGGSSKAFVEARRAYVEAKRSTRGER
jgi:hypothetical protein